MPTYITSSLVIQCPLSLVVGCSVFSRHSPFWPIAAFRITQDTYSKSSLMRFYYKYPSIKRPKIPGINDYDKNKRNAKELFIVVVVGLIYSKVLSFHCFRLIFCRLAAVWVNELKCKWIRVPSRELNRNRIFRIGLRINHIGNNRERKKKSG